MAIPIYPANLATFEGTRGTQTRCDVIRNLTPIIFSAHCSSIMSRWSLLKGGRGEVFMYLIVTGPRNFDDDIFFSKNHLKHVQPNIHLHRSKQKSIC